MRGAQNQRVNRWWTLRGWNRLVALSAFIGLLVGLLLGVTLGHGRPLRLEAQPGATNPAVTAANLGQTVCLANWTERVRPPTSYTNRVKAALGVPRVEWRLYELDHRVPLGAGGHPIDRMNLQIQRWAGPCNAYQKDRLERLVQRRLCSGRTTLGDAQHIFLSDWREAFQAYVDARGCAAKATQVLPRTFRSHP